MIGYKGFKLHNGKLYDESGYEYKLDEDNIHGGVLDTYRCYGTGIMLWKELKDVFPYVLINDKNNVYYKVESGDNVKTAPDDFFHNKVSLTDRLKILEKVDNYYLYKQYIIRKGRNCRIGFQNIPNKYITKELCEIAVKADPFSVLVIPEKYKTKELHELSVKQHGLSLEYVPEEYKTKELCEIAVKVNGLSIQYVPRKYMTKELCEIAVKQDGYSLKYIPKEYITEKLYILSLEQNNNSIQYLKTN